MIKTNDNKVITLDNIEVVDGDCKDCDWYSDCDDCCGELCIILIGVGKMIRKKEVWETCTKENTKVGDTIMNPRGELVILKYISDGYIAGSPHFDCLVRVDNWDITTTLSTHKIKLS